MSKTKRSMANGRTNGHVNGNGVNRLENLFGQKQEKEVVGPDLSIKHIIEPRTPNQKIYLKSLRSNDITFVTGPAGTGKAQTLDSIVYTPEGPKLMGDIEVGDEVCTPNGKSAKVLGVYPQGVKDIYRVVFSDNNFVECCKEHLWQVSGRDYKYIKDKIVDTEYLLKNVRKELFIPMTQPVRFNTQHVLIDPYVMGLWLGDGSFRGSSIRFSTSDQELIDAINARIDSDYYLKKKPNSKYDYSVQRKIKIGGVVNKYNQEIRDMGLHDKLSYEKHIPQKYLYNSVEVRWEILRGLMDSDGTVSKDGSKAHVSYSTTSIKLAEDVKFLVESLGGICIINNKQTYFTHKGIKKAGRPSFVCNLRFDDKTNLFKLERKRKLVKNNTKYKTRRFVDYVEYVGQKEAQCIYIDHPDHLYLTNNFIVTHNTHIGIGYAANALSKGQVERIVLVRPAVSCDEDLGFLPGDIQAKLGSYLRPSYDELLEFFTIQQLNMLTGGKFPIIEGAPLGQIKGRTFKNAVVILDEAQDATYKQLKSFLTRMGENSKLIITGDTNQSDTFNSAKETALEEVIEKMNGAEGVGFVKLTPFDIQRHPRIEQILSRL